MNVLWSELDIVSNPPKTPDAFLGAIQKWVDDADKESARERCIVVHFAGARESAMKVGVDWQGTIEATCQS